LGGTTNTAVTWSLMPNVGIVLNGLYTAPATVATQQTVELIATSAADPTRRAAVSLLLVPSANPVSQPSNVSINLSPANAALTGGQSATFTSTVSGTANTVVSWSLNPPVGTVANGVYTAPATISSQQMVTLTVTSAIDSTKTASATVLLSPGTNVSPVDLSEADVVVDTSETLSETGVDDLTAAKNIYSSASGPESNGGLSSDWALISSQFAMTRMRNINGLGDCAIDANGNLKGCRLS
jgi:hypothetical protein